jgi:hypothetical protein
MWYQIWKVRLSEPGTLSASYTFRQFPDDLDPIYTENCLFVSAKGK